MEPTSDLEGLIDAVDKLIDKGRPVFPLSGDKIPYANCRDCRGKTDAAHRATCECLISGKGLCHGFYAATLDKAQFAAHMEAHPDCTLIAVPTGKVTNLFVYEYDPKNGGDVSHKQLMEEHGEFETEANRSPSGGIHYIFQMPHFDFGNLHGKLAAGIDIKATGGYHLVPPSHDDRGSYEVINAMDPQPAPKWLVDKIFNLQSNQRWNNNPEDRLAAFREYDPEALTDGQKAHVQKTVTYWQKRIAESPDGSQNILIYTGARTLFSLCHAGLLDEEDTHSYLEEACQKGGHPQHRSLLAIDSGRRAAEADPDPVDIALTNDFSQLSSYSWDDVGVADRVVVEKGEEIRFETEKGKFYFWNGKKWGLVHEGAFNHIVIEVIKSMPKDAAHYNPIAMPASEHDKKSPRTYKELFEAHARSYRSTGKRNDVKAQLSGYPELWCENVEFDSSPYLFNVANGTIDIKSGELSPHDSTNMCTQMSKVEFDALATAPNWEEFIRLVQPNPVHRAYLQRLMGYSLFGEVIDQIFVVHIGAGGNGKGICLDIVQRVMGDYATTGQRETFGRTKGGRIPADLASYDKKRMVVVDELNDGQKMDDALLKDVTGGGVIKAEAKNLNPWEYTPMFTLHFRTNYMPDLPADDSTLRRFRVMPWTEKPTSEQWDRFRDDEQRNVANYFFNREGPGILNWLLAGAKDALENGLGVPDDLKVEAHNLLADNDPFSIFLREATVELVGYELEAAKFYDKFKKWAEDNNVDNIPSSKRLYNAIKQNQYKTLTWTYKRSRIYLTDRTWTA